MVAAAKVILDLQPVENVQDLAKVIIVNFVRLPNVDINHGAGGSVAGSSSANADGCYVYATELLSLGLVWHGFHDGYS